MNDETVKATGYIQVRPDWNNWSDHTSARDVRGARAVRLTQKRSATPEPGTVEVKVTLELPKAAFLPLMPEAIVVVPADLTVAHPVQVEATDPREAGE